MHYSQPQYLRRPLTEFSSRSLGSGLSLNNNPLPTIKHGTENSNARLVAALVGLSLLFCIYLYFLFRPIIKDKHCVAPYDSARSLNTTVIEDLEKGMPRRKSGEVGGEKPLEADVAAHLEKRKLHQWLYRASRGRFFSDSNNEASTQDQKQKTKKGTRYGRNKFMMPTICVSPPPPVYGSNGIKADPIYYLSDSHSNHQPQGSNNSAEENTLVQRPTHALLVPTKAASPKPTHHSLIPSTVSGNTKDMDATQMTRTRNSLARSGNGKIRAILSRSFTM